MASEQYLTYQKFVDKGEAQQLAQLLAAEQIDYRLEDHSLAFDPTFANNEQNNEFRIKLKKADFETADRLLAHVYDALTENVDPDYYLFAFTDQELIEVLINRDEWSRFDFSLARKILKARGREVSAEVLEALRKTRLATLAEPPASQKSWVYAGYLFAIVGGIVGLFIGWQLLTHKKTLPNGDVVHGYSASDRKHGKRILIVGVFFVVLGLIIKVLQPESGGPAASFGF